MSATAMAAPRWRPRRRSDPFDPGWNPSSIPPAAAQARPSTPGALAAALAASRADTPALFARYERALPGLQVPLRAEPNPPLWELGHVGRFQDCWLARFLAWRQGWRADPEGPRRRPLDEAACHLSGFEAEAWCRWAGRRLPTEAERERAAIGRPDGFRWGQVWEWTASPFAPYPGFRPHPGGDDSAPWFDGRPVLRGASFMTQPRLRHPHYLDFVAAHRNDVPAGFRSCAT
ncbi:MAG: SUMF1/EgtB/PvdO family nonheme iron enzyme [Burkholderiaceae bacterium]|nr:SUMF1/EgtB/PvdO family nonheme iron enzyme [Burkholderiaceae bacterium]